MSACIERAPRNRKVSTKGSETSRYREWLVRVDNPVSLGDVLNRDRWLGVFGENEETMEKGHE